MLTRRGWASEFGGSAGALSGVLGVSLLIVAVLTAALAALEQVVDVGTVTIIYLMAVLFAATRGGSLPALITAVAAIAVAMFFLYPPVYDIRVYSPAHLVDLALFIIVALVTGKLASDVRKAKVREREDALRDALINSVSHELRTPLSSIIGSASVLAESPKIANDEQLSALLTGLNEEAERLNEHIQNLLDATRISSESLRPRVQWVDPSDIVNAALQRKDKLLSSYEVEVILDDRLPLLRLDPTLVEKALCQVLENAAKYSAPHSRIEIIADHCDGMVRFAVKDQGAGISADEQERIWERFYRGRRHRDSTLGSGLGLWIARALVGACNGRVEAVSGGIGQGATVALYLPAPQQSEGKGGEPRDD
jgi:K+-sensing histidine kinase KdpD